MFIQYMMILVPLFVTFLVITLSYYFWHWTFWRRRGINGPPSIPVFGNKLSLVWPNASVPLVLREWTKKYGTTYGIQDGIEQTLVTSDPEIVREVFLKQFENFYERKALVTNSPNDPRVHVFNANGSRWKRLRTISSPTFTSGNLRKLHGTIENSVLEIISHIERNSESPINFEDYYQEFTMDVIGRIAMGQTESRMFNNPMVKIIATRLNVLVTLLLTVRSILPGFMAKYLGFEVLSKLSSQKHPLIQIMETCEAAVVSRIQQRDKDLAAGIEPGDPIDFIDLFLDARSDELFDDAEFSKEHVKVSRQLTTDEIIAQCFVFMIAGFDTTSIALSFTTHLLATHPEIQEKVQDEIARECPNPTIDFDTLGRLTYIDAVVKETLRLYPLASMVNSRRCVNETIIGDLKIEKGMYVAADTWTLHCDKSLWGENAAEFVPERWLEGDVNKNNWIPFGHGPRQCIGMRLALMEEKLLLAHLLRRYTIVPGTKTEKCEVTGPFIVRPASTWFNVVDRNT